MAPDSLQIALLCMFHSFVIPYNVAFGSTIVFTKTPNDVKTGLTPSLTLNCSVAATAASGSIIGRRDLTQTAENIESVTSFVIMKDGKDIASVSQNHAAHVMDGSSNVYASGTVTGASQQSRFLQLVITDPSPNQTGEFVCEANTLSLTGHVIPLTTSIEVTSSTPTLADLVSAVRDLHTTNAGLQSQVTNLVENNKDLEKTNLDLKNTIQALEQTVAQLQNRSNEMVFFNAKGPSPTHYNPQDVIVFNHIIDQIGNDYNNVNGLFTCSVAGYYDFSLGCLSQYDKNFRIDIYHNATKIFSIYATSDNGHQAAANSGTVQLARGDTVKAIAYYESWLNGEHCSFSGHLIKST